MVLTGEITKDMLRIKKTRIILTNEAFARVGKVDWLFGRTNEFLVGDLFERKTYNVPGHVAIKPLDRNLCMNITLDEIKAVVIP